MDSKKKTEANGTQLTRRDFIKSASIGSIGILAAPFITSCGKDVSNDGTEQALSTLPDLAAYDRALVNTSDSPNAPLRSLDMDAAKWTEGFWAERFQVAQESMVPHMGKMLQDPEISHAFRNFEIAA